MNALPYRGWQFVFPRVIVHRDEPGIDLLEGEQTGLQAAADGKVNMIEDLYDIRQSIYMLLSTVPGERVMRPDYGCLIHRLIFSPNDDTTAGLAIYYVRRAIEQWERRIDIIRLDAGRSPYSDQPEWLHISLTYQVRATQLIDTLSFPLNLIGE